MPAGPRVIGSESCSTGRPSGVSLAATVAGVDCRHALEAAARLAGASRVDFVTSTAAMAGVRNAYPEPGLLGVDRWVRGDRRLSPRARGVLRGRRRHGGDARYGRRVGAHLGGFIVPGPQMMVRSLHRARATWPRTPLPSPVGGAQLFADNTRDAIERGCRVALAALVDRTYAELARRTQTAAAPVLHRRRGGRSAAIRTCHRTSGCRTSSCADSRASLDATLER